MTLRNCKWRCYVTCTFIDFSNIIKKNGDVKVLEDGDLRKHLIEEMADVLMYYNDVLLCYGISYEELEEAYKNKFEKNMNRW